MLANHMHWFFSVAGDMEQPVEPSIFDIFNWIRQNGCEKKCVYYVILSEWIYFVIDCLEWRQKVMIAVV